MRSEYKYLVPEALLTRLRDEVGPFVDPDPHMTGLENRGYTVRSIYLDTAALRYYFEKKAGLLVRRKLRIRAYNDPRPGDWIFLEIKRKVDDKITKNRAPTTFKNLETLIRTGDVENLVCQNPHYPMAFEDGRRFLYHVYRYSLAPTFMTVYEREAFVGRTDRTFRITFDRSLRGRAYASLVDLYSEEELRRVLPGAFILEVKFNTRFPSWLRSVLGRNNLRHEALSKYCMCGEGSGHHVDSKVEVLSNIEAPVYAGGSHNGTLVHGLEDTSGPADGHGVEHRRR